MLNRSASPAMSTNVLKVLPGKLDIKRHSPIILCFAVRITQNDAQSISLFIFGGYTPLRCDDVSIRGTLKIVQL